MAINRAWFDALVDDTGTGTTGTVWNKAAIAGLLDAIDAMLEGHKTWVPLLQFGGASTGWTYTATGRYARADTLVLAEAQITISGVGSAAGIATVSGLPYLAATDTSPLAQVDPASSLAGVTGAGLGVYAGGVVYLVMQPPATPASNRVSMTHSNFPTGAQINFSLAYRRG